MNGKLHSPLYPMFVRLSGKRCVVVGGGQVAERKIAALLDCGGTVVVISPQATGAIERWAEQGDLHWIRQQYEPELLAAAFIVIAATNRREINRQIAADASRLGIPADIVDDPELGDFISPAVVRRGRLTIAVATSGASPSVTKRICLELENLYGEEYGTYLEMMAEVRAVLQERVADEALRRRMLQEIAAWDVLESIRSGRFAEEKDKLVAEIREKPAWETVARMSDRFRK